MALQTNSINLHTIRLNKLDDSTGTFGFRFSVFEVVVIIVELCVWVGGSSKPECDWEVCNADGA